MTYTPAASQFDAIQYTGSNVPDIQTWLSEHSQPAWGGSHLYQEPGNTQLLIINGEAQIYINETDWLVTTNSTSGFPLQLPYAPISAGPNALSNFLGMSNDQFTAWFTS